MAGYSARSEPNYRLVAVAILLGLGLIASLWYAFSPASKPVISEAFDDPIPEYKQKSPAELRAELKEERSKSFSYNEALNRAGSRIEELSHEIGRLQSTASATQGAVFPPPESDVRPLSHTALRPSARDGWEVYGEVMNFGRAPAEGYADIQLLVGLEPVEGIVSIRMGPIPPGGRLGYQAIFDLVPKNPRNPQIQVNATWRPILNDPPPEAPRSSGGENIF